MALKIKKTDCDVGGDRIHLLPPLPNGQTPYVRHRADHSIVKGLCHEARDGEPLLGRKLFTVSDYDPERGDFAVTGEYDDGAGAAAASVAKGPAKVNSPAFTEGWERIFGGKVSRGEA